MYMNEKNTPRDFFLHAGAFVSLYFGAIALVELLFDVINVSFPDPLASAYYSDPYSATLRFAIASLIVLAPITVYLFHLIQTETRRAPERKSLGVRKWLTYITLFIAGITVVGDVIILLNSFLGGTLPTPFLLKTAVILVVMGAGFAYFLMDIKGYWLQNATHSRYVGLGVVGMVLVSIVGGMILIGSPITQRNIRIDNQQINDLSMVSQGLLSYWQQTKSLPKDLATLENDFSNFRIPVSPDGQSAYEYVRTGDLSFKLCATFLQQSQDQSAKTTYIEPGFVEPPQWTHDAGRTCFERTIDPAVFTPKVPVGAVNVAPGKFPVPASSIE